jgi:hypothetical protein
VARGVDGAGTARGDGSMGMRLGSPDGSAGMPTQVLTPSPSVAVSAL